MTLHAHWLAASVAAELVAIPALARVQRRMLAAAGTRVTSIRMTALAYASNAMSATLPGGTAFAAAYSMRRMRSWGASGPAATFALVASGLLSTVAFAGLLCAWTLLASAGAAQAATSCAGAVVVIGAAQLSRTERGGRVLEQVLRRALRAVNRLRRRPADAGYATLDGFAANLAMISPTRRDWAAGLGWSFVNWLADLGCLFLSARAVGAGTVTISLAMAAYLAGTSASSFSPLPAGMGLADVGMVAVLVHGGLKTGRAGACVLCFRLISVALVVAVGWVVCAAAWRRARPDRGFPGFDRRPTALASPAVSMTEPAPRSSDENHRLHEGNRSPAR